MQSASCALALNSYAVSADSRYQLSLSLSCTHTCPPFSLASFSPKSFAYIFFAHILIFSAWFSQEMPRSSFTVELDAANASWLSNDVVLLSTKTGELLLLTLVYDGRSIIAILLYFMFMLFSFLNFLSFEETELVTCSLSPLGDYSPLFTWHGKILTCFLYIFFFVLSVVLIFFFQK